MDIQYNSWLKKFKKPFGAIKENTSVDFTIKVISNETIQSVSLVVKKAGEMTEITEKLMGLEQPNWYKCIYQFNKKSGLYFYYFKIIARNQEGELFCLYYGKGDTGGEGYQYVDESQIKWYQITCFEQEDHAPEWYQKGCAYQIFPDRFFHGNENKQIDFPKKNSFIYGQKEDRPYYIKNQLGHIDRWDFYGGNLKGIKEKIPYLKKLGVTIIYLNPIFEATSNHRYDTNDYFKVDPVLGTNEEFRLLVESLHENGIRLILDGVFSHVGRDSKYFNYQGLYKEEEGAYQSPHSSYFDWFTFLQYPDDYQSWWGVKDLPEINKRTLSYQQFIYGNKSNVISFWQKYKIDGWRLDVVDELPNFFIEGIRHRVDQDSEKVLIGEVWEDASNKVSYNESKEYASHPMLHGVMNYPLREQILDLVNERKPMKTIISDMMVQKENYPDYFSLNALNNIGTHDTRRLLTVCNEEIAKVKLAMSLMYVMPGVPCIYYGDEVGLPGEKDPDNRRFYPWETPNQELRSFCQSLNVIRKKHASILLGRYHILYSKKNHLFGIHRYTEQEDILCLFNFSEFEKNIFEYEWSCNELESIEIDKLFGKFDFSSQLIEKEHSVFLVSRTK